MLAVRPSHYCSSFCDAFRDLALHACRTLVLKLWYNALHEHIGSRPAPAMMRSPMTVYGIETTLAFPPYRFQVTFDSGAEVGLHQRCIEWSEQDQDGHWSEPRWVRSFYFEDCDQRYIHNFCKKFAQ